MSTAVAQTAPAAVSLRLSQAEVLAGVRELPPLPAVVMDLIRSMRDESLGAEQLGARIGRDQALAARTLRLANSPFYGVPRKVTCVAEATTLLGLRTVRSLALGAGVAGSFSTPACAGFDFAAFWRHSIGAALCAASLARALRQDEGLAFTVGLLHDIGCLALASGFGEAYAGVLRHQQAHDCPVQEAERAVLGTDHAAVGALLAEHWRFAPAVVEAIAAHHAPPAADPATLPTQSTQTTATARMADIAHVADSMAHALDLSGLEDDVVPPLSMPAWCRLALDEQRCLEVMARAQSQHATVCAAILS
ncbi:MAG TPA: HDOD domain-containing protein [Methylibium sp.]|nr:HDOD domain-containing protein [Methylibium sp.]